ncbi:MAG: hypothetical protein HQK95_04350 [Nitrospirae bacterium]|nr:hypothetical protein [Nitrospirota bacterium]
MNEAKTMRRLHIIRENNYERMKNLSFKMQIEIIRTEAEPIKKRLLDRMKKRELPALD